MTTDRWVWWYLSVCVHVFVCVYCGCVCVYCGCMCVLCVCCGWLSATDAMTTDRWVNRGCCVRLWVGWLLCMIWVFMCVYCRCLCGCVGCVCIVCMCVCGCVFLTYRLTRLLYLYPLFHTPGIIATHPHTHPHIPSSVSLPHRYWEQHSSLTPRSHTSLSYTPLSYTLLHHHTDTGSNTLSPC